MLSAFHLCAASLVVVFLFIISKFFNGRSESTSTPLPTVAVPAPTPKAPPKRTSPLDALRPKYNDAGQGQVFKYADEGKLTPAQETALAAQLSKLDLARIAKLHKDAMAFDAKGQSDLGKLEPLDSYDSIESSSAKQKKQWTDRGYDSISRGECAALVLAGGAGSRLGFEFPKGMYDIGLPSKKPLYQLFAERLRMLSHLASKSTGSPERAIPWYVMTSEGDNHTHTTKFFEDNKYFGYGKQNVVFFSQGTLPCMTLEGKIMLESGCKVGAAADGNGGVYAALQKTGQLKNMATRGVKYVHCFSVDNAIGKVCDPLFMGYCIGQGAEVGNKVVWKVEPGEKIGVIGKRKGKYTVIEYSEMNEEDCAKKDTKGKLVYGAGNVCNHFYTLDFLSKVTDDALIFHVARKQIKTPTADGQTGAKPKENTGIKLECFIFDCFDMASKMAVLEGLRSEEFSPVKNAPGTPKDSPDSARAMLTAQSKNWLRDSGIKVVDGPGQLELGPYVSYRGEGLATLKKSLKGKPVNLAKDVLIDAKAPGQYK